jgi:hypothetical protein
LHHLGWIRCKYKKSDEINRMRQNGEWQNAPKFIAALEHVAGQPHTLLS